MRRVIGTLSMAASLAVLLASPVKAADHAVSLQNNQFSPATLTIVAGDTVTWTHAEADPRPHSVTSTGNFDSSPNCPPACLAPGDTFQHTFDQAGTFDYFCKIHGSMTGQIVVQAQQATTTTAAPTTSTSLAPATTTTTTAASAPTPTTAAAPPTTAGPAVAGTQMTSGALAATGTPALLLAALGLVLLVGGAVLIRRSRPAHG